MSRRHILTILSIITLSTGIYAQNPDSLYCAPIEKIRIIVHKASLLSYANSVIDAQDSTIHAAVKLQTSTDSLLSIRTETLGLVRADLRDSTALLGVYLKEETRKRKRNGWVRNLFIGTTAGLIYLLIKQE